MTLRWYLLLAILCAVGCTGKSTTPAEGDTTSVSRFSESAVPDESKSFGDFSFQTPSGWSVVTPDRDKTKAMLLLEGTTWQNAKAMIKVDVGSPAAPTGEQLAEGFANSAGGKVSPDVLDFDGTPGVSVSTSSTEMTTPRQMIIVYRDGKAYLLMIGATAGVDIGDAVSHVRESWKWKNPNAG